jgi:hypothetical protein
MKWQSQSNSSFPIMNRIDKLYYRKPLVIRKKKMVVEERLFRQRFIKELKRIVILSQLGSGFHLYGADNIA